MSRARGRGTTFTTYRQRPTAQEEGSRLPPLIAPSRAPDPPPPRPDPPKRDRKADLLMCAPRRHTTVKPSIRANARRMPAIGGATGAAAVVTGGGAGAGCGATVDVTAAGWPTAGSCTSSSSNFIQLPTRCEACLHICKISVELCQLTKTRGCMCSCSNWPKLGRLQYRRRME